MTLRDLVQQAGGINSPAMDYELLSTTSETTKMEGIHSSIKKEDVMIVHHNQTIFIKERQAKR